jgi:hypothetical protein
VAPLGHVNACPGFPIRVLERIANPLILPAFQPEKVGDDGAACGFASLVASLVFLVRQSLLRFRKFPPLPAFLDPNANVVVGANADLARFGQRNSAVIF